MEGKSNNIKTLLDLKIVPMSNEHLVTEEKLYRFSTEGVPVLTLPHGSLIYTGIIRKGPGGFSHAEFGVWKGKEEIEEKKLICVKQKS